MQPEQLLWTALRTLAVYVLMLVIVRALGKREIGNFSAFDLLVSLTLGEIVDEAIYGDVSMAQFAVAAVLIAGCQYVSGWLSCKSPKIDRVLQGSPTILIRNGEIDRDALRKERVAEAEVMAMLREHGIDDLREVKLGVLEVVGQLSVIQEDWAQPVQKGDLPGEESRQKQEDTNGQEDPPEGRWTCSAEALYGKAA
jgi:uncharacterized membrane protein YcaP (DUF421 family)